VREQTDLKLGIEADFVPGREDRMAELLAGRDWDYVVGSIHFVGDGALDYEKYDVWTRASSPDKVWRTYFEMLRELRAVGPVRRARPPRPRQALGRRAAAPGARPALLLRDRDGGHRRVGHRRRGLHRGLRKPVGRIYPDRAFLEMVVDAGQPDRAVRATRTCPTSSATPTTGRSSCSTTSASGAVRVRAPRAPLEPIGAT
jgi:histidinol-phosphatase (PHP family)